MSLDADVILVGAINPKTERAKFCRVTLDWLNLHNVVQSSDREHYGREVVESIFASAQYIEADVDFAVGFDFHNV